jgi:hypothetical protein
MNLSSLLRLLLERETDSFDQRIINQQHPHQNTIIAYRPWTNIVCPTLQ